MKRYLLLIASIILFVFNGCKKDGNNNTTPAVVPGISIQTITYPSFANSTWNNVVGGTALLQFDLLGSGGAVSSSTTESTSLSNITSYNKTLSKGVYNIYVSSKNQSAAADTFIRFNAQLKSYSVSAQQALSFMATSTDGLITIGQSFVQSNTVPTFKTDTGTKAYKFGLSNEFYYLYVKGGLKGSVSFVSKTGNQTFTKSLSITALTQYNMALQTVNGSLQVVFVPFVYNQVAVSSSTLVTLNVNPNDVILSTSSSAYFVVTDANGNILNEVKYIQGTSTFKISSLQPYTNDRFNFFEIYVPKDANAKPGIIGFLQVKKGSVYTTDASLLPQKPSFPITLHLKNTTGFDQLNVSTDIAGTSINSLADSTSLQGLPYSNGDKLWVQMLKNNQYSYNFFNIAAGTVNDNVDLSQLTETPLTESISAPGNNLQVEVFAKTDTNYSNTYNFGVTRSQSGTLNYYYPSETFQQYDVLMFYSIGSLNYTIGTAGATIPNQAAAFNASFTNTASALANFVPSYSGTFDYYHANFQNASSSPNLEVDLYSPSAANYTNIKLPDFSKYLGVTSVDLSTLILQTFGLYQVDGFSEANFFYKDYHSYLNVNSKAVEQSY